MLRVPAVFACLTLRLLSPSAGAESTIDPAARYAYGANLGWINLEGDGTNGVVVGEAYLSGSAYGANLGWLSFGDGTPANGYAYANDSASDYGVNNDGSGNLSGYAYGANIGWVHFGWASPSDPDRPRVDLLTGTFDGFAYGANVGWINLGAGYLATSNLDYPDADADGIADWWEEKHFGDTTTANATSDFDRDQVSDRNEYLGGSDPQDPSDFFRVVMTEVSPATPPLRDVTVEFSSSEGRVYQILVGSGLPPVDDSGLGIFAPDPGGRTTKVLTVNGFTRFFRVVAIRPLP